jgi:hypothetical protein
MLTIEVIPASLSPRPVQVWSGKPIGCTRTVCRRPNRVDVMQAVGAVHQRPHVMSALEQQAGGIAPGPAGGSGDQQGGGVGVLSLLNSS